MAVMLTTNTIHPQATHAIKRLTNTQAHHELVWSVCTQHAHMHTTHLGGK